MAEWIYELGIGEARAALVSGGDILELAIDRDDGRLRAGAIVAVRIARVADATGRAFGELADGAPARIERLPRGATQGMTIAAEVVREAIDEGGGQVKPPRLIASDEAERPGPTLAERIAATGLPVRRGAAHLPDALEAAGWSEAIEEAASGVVARDTALLRIVPTPAMTLIDVDGASAPEDLAVAGAGAAGRAIRRFDIGGSIGIDLPTIEGKAARQAAAAALDAALPPPFERTAVNGFGFLQIVRRRRRASLVELLRHDPVTAAACALLRRAERVRGAGAVTLTAAPAVIARIEREAGWVATLAARRGGAIGLRVVPGMAISAGDAAATPL
ncbi:MAG: ribonuclease [Sphingomonas fennica]